MNFEANYDRAINRVVTFTTNNLNENCDGRKISVYFLNDFPRKNF